MVTEGLHIATTRSSGRGRRSAYRGPGGTAIAALASHQHPQPLHHLSTQLLQLQKHLTKNIILCSIAMSIVNIFDICWQILSYCMRNYVKSSSGVTLSCAAHWPNTDYRFCNKRNHARVHEIRPYWPRETSRRSRYAKRLGLVSLIGLRTEYKSHDVSFKWKSGGR